MVMGRNEKEINDGSLSSISIHYSDCYTKALSIGDVNTYEHYRMELLALSYFTLLYSIGLFPLYQYQ